MGKYLVKKDMVFMRSVPLELELKLKYYVVKKKQIRRKINVDDDKQMNFAFEICWDADSCIELHFTTTIAIKMRCCSCVLSLSSIVD